MRYCNLWSLWRLICRNWHRLTNRLGLQMFLWMLFTNSKDTWLLTNRAHYWTVLGWNLIRYCFLQLLHILRWKWIRVGALRLKIDWSFFYKDTFFNQRNTFFCNVRTRLNNNFLYFIWFRYLMLGLSLGQLLSTIYHIFW